MSSSNKQPSNEEDATASPRDSKCKKRKGRGSTILLEITKNRSAGLNLVVEYNDDGQPVGKDESKFASYLGVLARTMVTIVYEDWFEVPAHLKDILWSSVESSFDVDPRSRKKVLASISIKWRTFKYNLTKRIHKCKSDPHLLSKPPEIYSFIQQKNWDSFVKKRISKSFEEKSKVQQKSWSFNKFNHRIGRKGYANFRAELEQAQKLVVGTSDPSSAPNSGTLSKPKTKKFDRSIMWKKARQNKNGEYDDEEIVKQVAKIDEITKHVEDGSLSIQGSKDILTIALGTNEHSGRIRGVGGFVTPSTYFHMPRRGIHSSCEEKQKFFEATLSQLRKEIDALKQSTPNTPHSDFASSNTFKSDNMGSLQLHPSPLVNNVKNIYDMAPLDPVRVENVVMTNDDMAPPDPQPPKVKRSKPCQLAVGSREHIVAHGTVYERTGPLEKIHTVPLGPANVRVSIDLVIVEDALLPIPIPGEAATVGEAVGYQVAWPKKLIVINYEVASKYHGVVGDEVTSKNVNWEKNLESIRSFTFLIQNIRYEKAIKIAYEKELFGEEVDFHLQKVDMEYICELKEVSVTCIVVYMSYLYDVMKAPNMHRSFLFVNPYITSARKKPSDNANATLLARRLEDAKPGELVVAPCNIGFHWSLLVIDASASTVYYLDSVLDEVPMDVKILIRCAIIIYEGNKGNKMKGLVWQVVQCPKQAATVECGFYVMMFMRELMKDKSILSKNNNFNGRKTYTKAEIDEVRIEWINFVMTKYEQHLF